MRCTHHRKRGYRVSIRLSTGSAHDQKAAYEAGILQHLEPKSITADKGYQDTGCNHVCEKTVSEVSESSAYKSVEDSFLGSSLTLGRGQKGALDRVEVMSLENS